MMDRSQTIFALLPLFCLTLAVCGCHDRPAADSVATVHHENAGEDEVSRAESTESLRYPREALLVSTTASQPIFRLPPNAAELNIEVSDPIVALRRLPEVEDRHVFTPARPKVTREQTPPAAPQVTPPAVEVETAEETAAETKSDTETDTLPAVIENQWVKNDSQSRWSQFTQPQQPEAPRLPVVPAETDDNTSASLWRLPEAVDEVAKELAAPIVKKEEVVEVVKAPPFQRAKPKVQAPAAPIPVPSEPLPKLEESIPLPSRTELLPPKEEKVESPAVPVRTAPVEEVSAQLKPSPKPRLTPDPMRAVNARANATIRNAFSLAQRGATYSARVEMVEALRMTAEALDLRDGTRRHSDALKRGFVALDEADDFQQRGLAAELDLEVLVAAHQTPMLKQADLSNTTPLVGLQKYLTYAQGQLALAAGEQPTASLALYGLGRLQVDMAEADDNALPRAIVFHQAAVTTDSMNYKAANELGVLLARYGQYEQARQMLAHSVRVCPQAESWRNLSKIHEQLGEHDLARRAIHESQLAARGTAGRNAGVRWVDPAALAGTIETNPGGAPVARTREVPAPSATRNVTQENSEGLMRLIPWIRGG